MNSRRQFIQSVSAILLSTRSLTSSKHIREEKVMTVLGAVDSREMGRTLIHEHLLVDFIGAAKINPNRWDHLQVIQTMLPYLKEVKSAGCKTFVDCTPNYLGRDVQLLRKLSELSGMQIMTNTGYYGGSDPKFLPAQVFQENSFQLSRRWIDEFESGIEGSGVKPGFIKISVNNSKLSDVSIKLIEAAALTHLQTGLTIASHTGGSIPAFEQLDILESKGVRPDAFIWVHAQNESKFSKFETAGRKGCWVSLDGVSTDNIQTYLEMLTFMKQKECLHRTLISHDAGWYDPEKGGGNVRKYTTIFERLIPRMLKSGFTEKDVDQVFVVNPQEAFTIKTRTLK